MEIKINLKFNFMKLIYTDSRSVVADGWGRRTKGEGGITKGYGKHFWVINMFIVLTVVMVLQMYAYVKTHQIIYFIFATFLTRKNDVH